MDFEKIRIACICEPNLVQGLQWALDQDSTLGFEFELIQCSLKDIPSLKSDVDLYFFNLDLGQPLPVESLKAFSPKPGLVIALHPTPHQLLSVFEVPALAALSWNGQTFEEIVSKISEATQRQIESIRKERLLENLQTWNQAHRHWPAQIHWISPLNPKEISFFLDEKSALSIGGAQSGCDISLETPGGYKIAEFLFYDSAWHFRVLQKELSPKGHYDPNNLSAGEHIELEGHIFQIKSHPVLESMTSLFENSRVPGNQFSAASIGLENENLDLVGLCKRLMLQNRTCELRVQTAGKYGSIFFVAGQIEDAISGSNTGRKALLRILDWENCRWKVSLNQKKNYESPSLNLDISSFAGLVQSWTGKRQSVGTQSPPPQIRLSLDAQVFFKRSEWTADEVLVASAIAESGRVFEILNNCRLEDHLILENLIQFRKQGLIGILG